MDRAPLPLPSIRLRRRFSVGVAGMALLGCACAPCTLAQMASWPDKPIKLVVPYPPGGLTDTLARSVTDLTPAIAHIRAGKLKVLATTAPQRSAMLPEAPTFAEAGVNGVQAVAWQGIVAPAGTPRAVIERLSVEINRIVASDTLKSRCAAIGCDPLPPTSPAEFAELVKNNLVRWTQVVIDSGAKVD
jgi:tripartite-type tricarboxylate transporter receptor subunit TctC